MCMEEEEEEEVKDKVDNKCECVTFPDQAKMSELAQ